MPTELQIIRAQEFIRLGASGQGDLAASKAALAQLAGACLKRGINQALLDLREVRFGPKPVFSPKDLAVLVNTFHEIGFTHKQRLAVLYRTDPHRRARMFAFIAILHGWTVQAFDSYEAALTWLSSVEQESSEDETEYATRSRKIPVRKLSKASTKPAPRPAIRIKSSTGSKGGVIPPRPARNQTKPPGAAMAIVILGLLAGMAAQTASAQPLLADAAAAASATPSAFARTIPNHTPAPTNAPEGMAWIPGGEFSMGCAVPDEGVCTRATLASLNDALPVHRVYVDGFWMDTNDVTNEKFEQFVNATGTGRWRRSRQRRSSIPPRRRKISSPVPRFSHPRRSPCR